jgi:acetolactate synthase-1/2/3 large subunit
MGDALRQRIHEADLVIAVGTRMGEATTEGYTLVESPQPRQKLVHVYPDRTNSAGYSVRRCRLPPMSFAAAVAQLSPAQTVSRRGDDGGDAANANFLAEQEPKDAPGTLNLNRVACHVRDHVPDDACITVGAGNYALFAHAYHRFHGVGTSLAPTVGSMGYGLPAASRPSSRIRRVPWSATRAMAASR